jgi:hypothetical protein
VEDAGKPDASTVFLGPGAVFGLGGGNFLLRIGWAGYVLRMSTVQEIEEAVNALPKGDFDEVLFAVLRRARQLGTRPEPRRFSDEQIAAWVSDDEQGMEAFRRLRE